MTELHQSDVSKFSKMVNHTKLSKEHEICREQWQENVKKPQTNNCVILHTAALQNLIYPRWVIRFDGQAKYNNLREEGGKERGSIVITLEKGGWIDFVPELVNS